MYRVVTKADYDALAARGALSTYSGSPTLDADFIHLSTRDQLVETLRAYFAGVPVVIAEFAVASLDASALRWDAVPQRNNALFPHLYAPSLDLTSAKRVFCNVDEL